MCVTLVGSIGKYSVFFNGVCSCVIFKLMDLGKSFTFLIKRDWCAPHAYLLNPPSAAIGSGSFKE